MRRELVVTAEPQCCGNPLAEMCGGAALSAGGHTCAAAECTVQSRRAWVACERRREGRQRGRQPWDGWLRPALRPLGRQHSSGRTAMGASTTAVACGAPGTASA